MEGVKAVCPDVSMTCGLLFRVIRYRGDPATNLTTSAMPPKAEVGSEL